MFGWIARLFQRRDSSRAIFKFFGGTWWQRVDPVQAWLSLQSDPEWSMDKHLPALDAGGPESIEAAAITARAVRRAFGIKPLSEYGLTDEECLEVFRSFCLWSENIKKKVSGKPTLPLPTTTSRSSVISPKNFDTACGSTELEPISVEQS